MDGGDTDDITPSGSGHYPSDSPVRLEKKDRATAKQPVRHDRAGTTTPTDDVNTPRRELTYSAASRMALISPAQSTLATNAPLPPPCLPGRSGKSVRIVDDAQLALVGVNSSSSGYGGDGRGGSTSSVSAGDPIASAPPRVPQMVSVEPSLRLPSPHGTHQLTIPQVLPPPYVSTPAVGAARASAAATASGEELDHDSPTYSAIVPQSDSDSTVLESISARSTLTGGCPSPLSPGRTHAGPAAAGRDVSRLSSGSQDHEHPSNPCASSRRCYVPSRGARLYSLSPGSDGGRSHLIAAWSNSSKPTTPASQATTRLPHSSLRAFDSRDTRGSELSFMSETGSMTPPSSAWLTPGVGNDDSAHHRHVSAPPPPPKRLGAFTLSGGVAPQLLRPYAYSPPRALAQSPMLTPPPTLPQAPQLLTLNPLVLQRRLSDTPASRTLPAVVSPRPAAVGAGRAAVPGSAAVGHRARSPVARTPLLAGGSILACPRRGASRTPPVAVLVPLGAAAAMRHTPTPPLPPHGHASPVTTPPPLDGHTADTRAGSFACAALCRDRPVSPFSVLPGPEAGVRRDSCASVPVTPLHPSLTQLHVTAPSPADEPRVVAAASPAPERPPPHDTSHSTSLENYVADLTPLSTAGSFQCRLLGTAVALCAVPLAAVLLLLGLHCWAVTTQWHAYAPAVPPPHVGAMQQSKVALLVGALLAALVMGVGCGGFIYAVLYREGIRYQVQAFALCARLARASTETGASPARRSGPPLLSALEWSSDATPSQLVLRWHAEVGALLGALTCPVVEAPEWPMPVRPQHHVAPAHTSTDRPATDAALAGTSAVGDTGNHRVLTPTRQALSPTSRLWFTPASEGRRSPAEARLGQLGTAAALLYSGALVPCAPRSHGDTNKAREAVTVVLCRLHLPPELDTNGLALSLPQLGDLQLLCDEFHRRLRAVPRSRFVVVTEVSLTEVVFSLNTLYPMPSLVAGPEAVAVALALKTALSEWAPSHRGQALAWGVAVHRLSGTAYLPYARRGRRAVSFGGADYDFARRLAELAALCGHGALCHGNFLEAAACEPQSLAVDLVMDRQQETCVVYQLHRREVPETLRQHMSDAIASMSTGEFHVAARKLTLWRARCTGGHTAFPAAAAHLLYIAELLDSAVRLRVLSTPDDDATTATSTLTLSELENVEGWALKSLLSAYCRPPPVWEEELEESTPLLSPLTASKLRAAAPSPYSSATPPNTLRCAAAAVASRLRRWAGGGGSGSPAAAVQPATPAAPGSEVSSEPPRRPQARNVHPFAPCENVGPLTHPPPPLPPLPLSLLPPVLPPCANAVSSGNVLEAPLSPLSPLSRDAPAGGAQSQRGSAVVLTRAAPATPEPTTPTAALSEASKLEKVWAALALPTNPDQSILTFHATGPRLFSASCSLAGSVLAEGGPTTPMPPSVLRTSHPDGRRGRQAPVLLLTPGQDGVPVAHVRRDSRGGGSVSQTVTDVPAMSDAVSKATSAASTSQALEAAMMPHAAHEAGRESVSTRSVSSAPLSSSTRRRGSVSVAPSVSTVLPLFAELGLKAEGRGELTEAASELDLSAMSVVQRSRSRRSQRAPPQMSSVVCTCTKRIDGGTDDAVMVLRGFHPDGFLVAVKRVDLRSAKQVRLLRNEVELLADMRHENVVRAISSWADTEAEYLAMEHACETLADVLRKFKVLLPRVARFYTRELLTALVYLHGSRGVVHRDLSPKNIIITTTTECSHVKLIDFGRSVVLPATHSNSGGRAAGAALSTMVPDSTSAILEETHSLGVVAAAVVLPVAGTPLFMSPEACQGIVHPANDVWSLGVIVHLCLTGSYPYPPDVCSDAETFVADVAAGRVVPVLAGTSQLHGKARHFVEQCLQVEHGKRPSAAALLRDSFVKR